MLREKERKSCSLFLINTRKKVRKSWTAGDDSTEYVDGSPITIQKTDKSTKRNLWMKKKVRKITVYNKKLKVDTLTKHVSDIVNRQLDVKIIHVDTNRQWSITASQNIFNSIYTTNVELTLVTKVVANQQSMGGRSAHVKNCSLDLWAIQMSKLLSIGSLILKGQYVKCLSTCQLSGVKVLL